jgi:hypothetical protein
MQTPLEMYESGLNSVTDVCADPWFTEQLALLQAGDEQAARSISGSCLQLVLDIAKRRWGSKCALSFLEFVEEGNIVLWKTIKRFSGSSAQEFLQQLTQKVESWYTILSEHPSWAKEQRDKPAN